MVSFSQLAQTTQNFVRRLGLVRFLSSFRFNLPENYKEVHKLVSLISGTDQVGN